MNATLGEVLVGILESGCRKEADIVITFGSWGSYRKYRSGTQVSMTERYKGSWREMIIAPVDQGESRTPGGSDPLVSLTDVHQ